MPIYSLSITLSPNKSHNRRISVSAEKFNLPLGCTFSNGYNANELTCNPGTNVLPYFS